MKTPTFIGTVQRFDIIMFSVLHFIGTDSPSSSVAPEMLRYDSGKATVEL